MMEKQTSAESLNLCLRPLGRHGESLSSERGSSPRNADVLAAALYSELISALLLSVIVITLLGVMGSIAGRSGVWSPTEVQTARA
jgi:hypothetical protein